MKAFEISGGEKITLALFTDVANSKKLLDLMQAGTLDPEVAFLNASLIPDVFPVLAAAHKMVTAKSRDSLRTRTPHSELVYNYSGSKHMKAVGELVKGKEIDLEELKNKASQAQILKHYKITSQELAISSLADAIACRIAVRDAL
uniref:Uncharacterized protein n=1 Tax=Kalanchoe fedtschenkoi TaxID=63787 RepID=A0A7N0TEE5_KALFE